LLDGFDVMPSFIGDLGIPIGFNFSIGGVNFEIIASPEFDLSAMVMRPEEAIAAAETAATESAMDNESSTQDDTSDTTATDDAATPDASAEEEEEGRDPYVSIGLRVSGTVPHLLGMNNVYISMEFVTDDTRSKKVVTKIKTTDTNIPLSIGDMLGDIPLLAPVSSIRLSDPAIALATEEVDDDTEEPFDVGIAQGFNFYGTITVNRNNVQDPLQSADPITATLAWLGYSALTAS